MREKALVTLCDEDIEIFDPKLKLTDEEFAIVAEEMTEYMEGSFQSALHCGINAVMMFRSNNPKEVN